MVMCSWEMGASDYDVNMVNLDYLFTNTMLQSPISGHLISAISALARLEAAAKGTGRVCELEGYKGCCFSQPTTGVYSIG